MSDDLQLSKEMITSSLSHVDKTLDGKGYAFVKLDVSGKGLDSLGGKLSAFKHIRYIKAMNNKVKDISTLIDIDSLLAVDMDRNIVESIPPFTNKYLQYLNLSNNKVSSFAGADAPFISTLNLSNNAVESLSGLEKLSGLVKLDLSSNKVSALDVSGSLSELKELNLENNAVDRIGSVGGLSSLESLRLVGNGALTTLDGLSSLSSLVSLNISATGVATVSELAKLSALKKLANLDASNAPVSETANCRQEVLLALPALVSFNNEKYTTEERMEARAVAKERAAKAAAPEEAKTE